MLVAGKSFCELRSDNANDFQMRIELKPQCEETTTRTLVLVIREEKGSEANDMTSSRNVWTHSRPISNERERKRTRVPAVRRHRL